MELLPKYSTWEAEERTAFDISVEQTMRSRLRKNGKKKIFNRVESSRIQGEQEVENNSNPQIKYHLCNANISIKYITSTK